MLTLFTRVPSVILSPERSVLKVIVALVPEEVVVQTCWLHTRYPLSRPMQSNSAPLERTLRSNSASLLRKMLIPASDNSCSNFGTTSGKTFVHSLHLLNESLSPNGCETKGRRPCVKFTNAIEQVPVGPFESLLAAITQTDH